MTFIPGLSWPSPRYVAAAICAAGILHIVLTLIGPELTQSPAYRTLAEGLPLNKFEVLPPVTPQSQKVPFMGPDAQYAACRFDARNGSVAVKAVLPGPGWVISIFSPAGDNIYSAVARPGQTLEISLKILPSEDRFAGLPSETGIGLPSAENALAVAAQKGVILIRAPDQGIPYRARNLAELQRANCAYRAT